MAGGRGIGLRLDIRDRMVGVGCVGGGIGSLVGVVCWVQGLRVLYTCIFFWIGLFVKRLVRDKRR